LNLATKLTSLVWRPAPAGTAIQMLWVGAGLSTLERLSISSFLHHGHDVHLYAYDDLEGVPHGVLVRDAAEILPRSRIFRYTETGSYAGFANFFRYKLLLTRGGWYVDADTVCLRPFDFTTPYVFSSEWGDGGAVANSTIMRAPRASKVMRRADRACRRSVPEELRWGDTGAQLIARELRACSLLGYVREPDIFCPVPYTDWAAVLDPARRPDVSSSYAIHLWHEMWRRSGQDKDAAYDRDCLYEELKRRYLCS
jgi:hypothetical protein